MRRSTGAAGRSAGSSPLTGYADAAGRGERAAGARAVRAAVKLQPITPTTTLLRAAVVQLRCNRADYLRARSAQAVGRRSRAKK